LTDTEISSLAEYFGCDAMKVEDAWKRRHGDISLNAPAVRRAQPVSRPS
jgi:hypothetical protein